MIKYFILFVVWGPILRDVSLDRDVTFTPENEEKIKSIKNFLTANFPNKEYPWKSLLGNFFFTKVTLSHMITSAYYFHSI